MAQVQLSRAEAQGGKLPSLCMQCGAPATDVVVRKYSTDKADLMPPPPEPVGCLIVMPLVLAAKAISWANAKTMEVRTPLCHKHAHSWFAWSSLDAAAITDDTIAIKGVSEAFKDALDEARQSMPPQQPATGERVKVRCRACQSLNDEAAKYCGQCGGIL